MVSEPDISRLTVIKCLGPRLVPFFKMVALFYVIFPDPEVSLGYLAFKCAPILCLIGFVFMYGLRTPHKKSYTQKVLLGLIFSCIGDAFLVYPGIYFKIGVVCFAIAHILYVSAFGLRPLALHVLPFVLTIIAFVWIYCSSHISSDFKVIGAIYGLLLSFMIWRAIAQLLTGESKIPWTSISRALGAALFGISDSILSLVFIGGANNKLKFLILPTYYAAQMCLTVSVVDRKLLSLKAGSHSD